MKKLLSFAQIVVFHIVIFSSHGSEIRTDIQSNGNKVVQMPALWTDLESFSIDLDSQPEWILSTPWKNGTKWMVQSNSGSIYQFFKQGDRITRLETLVCNASPALWVQSRPFTRFYCPEASLSSETAPTYLGKDFGYAWIDNQNRFVNQRNGKTFSLPINALPDSRIVHNEDGIVVILSEPTSEYAHGVLGDVLEAKSITVIQCDPEPRVDRVIRMENNWVIEGTSAILSDWNQDGSHEILVTRTRNIDGAQHILYDLEGRELAKSDPIGRTFRWRHQLAIGPFGIEKDDPDKHQLVSVLTPHIGGVVQFFSWEGDKLKIEFQKSGWTSHIIATRNLDMALTGFFKDPNILSLVIPSQSRRNLDILTYKNNQLQEETIHTLNSGRIQTNISFTKGPSGSSHIGFGTSDNRLVILSEPPTIQSVFLHIKGENLEVYGPQTYQIPLEVSNNLVDWNSWKTIQTNESGHYFEPFSDGLPPNSFLRVHHISEEN